MARDEALALLRGDTKSESLLQHALAVEAAMRRYAEGFSVRASNEGRSCWT
jgi:predicted hydrolase (HD superfamily)